jgi:hypothetical protein
MRPSIVTLMLIGFASLLMTPDVLVMADRVVTSPAENLQQLGYPTDTVEQILTATRSESYFVRGQALEVLATRTGKEAIPTLKSFLSDPHVRVRSMSAHLLGTFGDKSGVGRMRQDLKELVPPDKTDPKDPNAIARANTMPKGGRNYLLREGLIVARVLAELGDHSGYSLAAKMALEGSVTVVRTEAVFALVEMAKADESVLLKEGIAPISVLCEVAASEKQEVPFGVLVNTVRVLKPQAAIQVLEAAGNSTRQSQLNRDVAQRVLDEVRRAEKPPK